MTRIVFDPLLPPAVLAALALVGLAGVVLRVRSAPLGAACRGLVVLAALGFLAGPTLRQAEAERLSDAALVLVDRSDSMALGGRDVVAEAALSTLTERLEAEGLEVVVRTLTGRTETALAPLLTDALGAVPRARLSAVFLLSDGQVTQAPDPSLLGDVPFHVLLAGDPERERDRRVHLVTEPRYGVVGERVEVTFRVEDEDGLVPVTLSAGGEAVLTEEVPANEDVTLRVPLSAPGETVVEITVPEVPGELTTANNRAAIRLNAVRDRLRVLLVSGEPHPGERVWRNILKSDPAVDLVHFTILRPMDKIVFAPERDLNLIAFPHRELFLDKLSEFDVVIFDRYTARGVLQSYAFERLARYVEDGGALLVASGPEFWGRSGLAAQRNLAPILPVLPEGPAVEGAFAPQISEVGARHPVTSGLSAEGWGRWLRVVPTAMRSGVSVLETPDGTPLLVLDRVGEGRVAMLNSDHVWLWARGFDGGGPHRELLRRLANWLMAEPSLEEEALRARADTGGAVRVERRTLEAAPSAVAAEGPDGRVAEVPLTEAAPGLFTGTVPVAGDGLLRLRTQTADGRTLYALAARGEARPPERDAVRTDPEPTRALAEASGGGRAVLGPQVRLPSLRRVAAGRRSAGEDWLGLPRRDASRVTSIAASPLLPRWAWLLLTLGGVVAAWWAEGRVGRSRR